MKFNFYDEDMDKTASYHTKPKKKKAKAKKSDMYKKAIAAVAKKVDKKKKSNFGMLSVKAGIDSNPAITKADRIAGAKMSKKAYAKDGFKPHMMYHGKKSKMAKTYEEHMALKKKGWGHTKTAATALTKSVLKHLKSGKGIKDTAKQLKVDEDLVVGVARKNIQSKTTARAIGKEQNKNMVQRFMSGSKKTEKGLREHAAASGGK